MALITEYASLDIFALLLVTVLGAVAYVKWAFSYWKRRGIPYVQPCFPTGTLANPYEKPKSFGETVKTQYDQFKGQKHVGLYAMMAPMYMPLTPELVKNMLTYDFDHFMDRGVYYNEKWDPLSAHLFLIEGRKWRNMRVKLTPTFTSGKMKMMFETLVQCGYQLEDLVQDITSKNLPLDIKDALARFTTDVIGSCAFGLDCNTCRDPNSDFRNHGKRIFNLTKMEIFRQTLGFASPKLASFLQLRLLPKQPADFFMKVIRDTVAYRETNNIVRKDFMHLLLQLKNQKNTLSLDELAAQAFVFFIAGFETSSTTMTFALFELAKNQDVQDKVRAEVQEVMGRHEQLTYDAIGEMKYLDQVISETLRKYPPLPGLNRVCVKEYHVPGTDLVLEKGTLVIIPVLGLHNDPDYFPNPEKFDPDRFNEENKPSIKPFTYLPFGEGPRICIGMRFGLMQTKVGLALLLKNNKFKLNSKTQLPLKLDPFNFIMSAEGDIWLDAEVV